jgi:hypothetical protein
MVSLTILTDCEKVSALAEALKGRQTDAYEEIARGSDGVVLSTALAMKQVPKP